MSPFAVIKSKIKSEICTNAACIIIVQSFIRITYNKNNLFRAKNRDTKRQNK